MGELKETIATLQDENTKYESKNEQLSNDIVEKNKQQTELQSTIAEFESKCLVLETKLNEKKVHDDARQHEENKVANAVAVSPFLQMNEKLQPIDEMIDALVSQWRLD